MADLNPSALALITEAAKKIRQPSPATVSGNPAKWLPADNEYLKAGDIVMLKSGGLHMTVLGIDKTERVCVAFTGENNFFNQNLPHEALMVLRPDR